MEKRHFERAAAMVRAILDGEWTNEPPSWAKPSRMVMLILEDQDDSDQYTRAVQTAEAYIILFRAFNSRFDESRFLIACGLAPELKRKDFPINLNPTPAEKADVKARLLRRRR